MVYITLPTLHCTINKVNAERFSISLDRVGNYLEFIIKDPNNITVPPRILIIFFREPNFSIFLAAEFKIRKV